MTLRFPEHDITLAIHILALSVITEAENNGVVFVFSRSKSKSAVCVELPQLFNVLRGEMSFVGPRPEVAEYTEMYSVEEQEILSVRPGITDLSSLTFSEGRLRWDLALFGPSL